LAAGAEAQVSCHIQTSGQQRYQVKAGAW